MDSPRVDANDSPSREIEVAESNTAWRNVTLEDEACRWVEAHRLLDHGLPKIYQLLRVPVSDNRGLQSCYIQIWELRGLRKGHRTGGYLALANSLVDLSLQLSVDPRVTRNVVEDCAKSNGERVMAGNAIKRSISFLEAAMKSKQEHMQKEKLHTY